METLRANSRTPWEDRFTRPTVRSLLGAMDKEPHSLVQHARETLASLPSLREDIAWKGVPWRWCFVFFHGQDEARAFAYVVPRPAKPILAVPIDSDIVSELPLKKLPKHIREVLTQAPLVGGVRWCQWDLASKPQIDDILNLARLKLPEEGDAKA